MTARRAAEFAAQRARATALVPGATQYQAQVGTLIRRTEFGITAITRWGLRDLDTGQVVADPSGATGPAAVTVPVAGHPGETYTYVMPGDHDGEPAPRLAEDIDTLIAWVRELRGVLHVGRQWYDLTGRKASQYPPARSAGASPEAGILLTAKAFRSVATITPGPADRSRVRSAPPASVSSTRAAASSVSRTASTHPAAPAPTMM